MKKILLILLAILLFGAMTLFGFGAYWWTDDPRPGAYAADPSSQRNTPQGKVVGFDAGFGAHGWLGIPYAAPPDGDLRWRAPRPVRPWSEPLQALQAGAPCPQIGGPLADVARSAYGDVVGDEDCLTLNIYAPYHPPGELEELGISYPVMVWIHGGGNTIGYGADYDGSRLAAKHAVVVVTINYRLGVLGWFNHPAIIGTANDPADASGNFGLLDQIAALRWVQDNIAYFGGNPEQVTVFGESAGGINAFALLASPPAR
ncbi:MAG: carboxylesterase family protein, partial [Pseudomonadota bacterium]